jgi:hypothetical protein
VQHATNAAKNKRKAAKKNQNQVALRPQKAQKSAQTTKQVPFFFLSLLPFSTIGSATRPIYIAIECAGAHTKTTERNRSSLRSWKNANLLQ